MKKMIRKNLRLAILGSTCMIALAGGASAVQAEDAGDSTLIVVTNAGPADLDPHGSTDQNTHDVCYQMYEPLVTVGVSGEIVPCLATEWNWVDDYTLDLTLRDGVTFHNGSEFSAEDVMYSLKRAAESEFTAAYLENVLLDECSILENGQVQIKLETPNSAFLSRLSQVMMIDGDTWNEEENPASPVGTGAYKFVNWYDGDRIEFAAYDGYWGDAAGYQNLTLRFIPESASRALEIEAGTADIALSVQASDVMTLESNPDVSLYSTPCYMITYLGYDCGKEPYSSREVRQALSYAIDKESICNVVYSSLATPANHGRMSEVYWGYAGDEVTSYEYDPEKARELLAEAGYENGFDMTLTLSESDQDQIMMSEIIQSQLSEVGINVQIEILENATYLDQIVEGGFDAFLCNSVGSSADPGEALKSFISTRPTWSNTTRYQNEELTAMIEKGQQTIDEEEKYDIFLEAQKIVADECPWVFLVHNEVTFAARNTVTGMTAYPSTAHYFKEAKPAE